MKLTDMPPGTLVPNSQRNRDAETDLATMIVKAFLRGEPLSREQQKIIARLFDGSLKRRRGRPKNKRLQNVETALTRRSDDYGLFKWISELAERAEILGYDGTPPGGAEARNC